MHPLKRLFEYAQAQRPQIYRASTYSVLNKIFDLAPPALIGTAIDVVVNQEQSFLSELGMTTILGQLSVLAAITVLIWGLESIFEYLFAIGWRNLAQGLQHQLRLDAYSHMQKLDLNYFENQSTGQLMSVLNDDVNQLERFLDGGANEILQVITTVTVIGTAFFYLAPTVAVFAFLPIPIILIGSFRFQKKLLPLYAAVRERVGMINSALANNLRGIATIKSYAAENHERERMEKLSHEYMQANSEAIQLSAAFSPLIRMAIVIGFTATLVWGGWLAVQGDLNVGVYSVMVYITQRLLWPLTRLGATFDLYQRALASIRRIFLILDRPIEIKNGRIPAPHLTGLGAIEFCDVNFSYIPGYPILKNFNLKIEPGSTVAIVGSTGSGKSTILKLLLRFYEPQSGEILVNGKNINEYDLQDLRRLMGLVSQEVYLFHGTVSENIRYGSFQKGIEDIQAAAEVAEATGFIQTLPEGFATVIGERGQKLSGGQQQRLSIARAVLKDPPILILDEATSAVDNETEAAIQRSLQKITINRTTVVIAHRLSTVRRADQIYVLDQGHLVERGRHEELVAKNGIYSNLWKVQTGEKILG